MSSLCFGCRNIILPMQLRTAEANRGAIARSSRAKAPTCERVRKKLERWLLARTLIQACLLRLAASLFSDENSVGNKDPQTSSHHGVKFPAPSAPILAAVIGPRLRNKKYTCSKFLSNRIEIATEIQILTKIESIFFLGECTLQKGVGCTGLAIGPLRGASSAHVPAWRGFPRRPPTQARAQRNVARIPGEATVRGESARGNLDVFSDPKMVSATTPKNKLLQLVPKTIKREKGPHLQKQFRTR